MVSDAESALARVRGAKELRAAMEAELAAVVERGRADRSHFWAQREELRSFMASAVEAEVAKEVVEAAEEEVRAAIEQQEQQQQQQQAEAGDQKRIDAASTLAVLQRCSTRDLDLDGLANAAAAAREAGVEQKQVGAAEDRVRRVRATREQARRALEAEPGPVTLEAAEVAGVAEEVLRSPRRVLLLQRQRLSEADLMHDPPPRMTAPPPQAAAPPHVQDQPRDQQPHGKAAPPTTTPRGTLITSLFNRSASSAQPPRLASSSTAATSSSPPIVPPISLRPQPPKALSPPRGPVPTLTSPPHGPEVQAYLDKARAASASPQRSRPIPATTVATSGTPPTRAAARGKVAARGAAEDDLDM